MRREYLGLGNLTLPNEEYLHSTFFSSNAITSPVLESIRLKVSFLAPLGSRMRLPPFFRIAMTRCQPFFFFTFFVCDLTASMARLISASPCCNEYCLVKGNLTLLMFTFSSKAQSLSAVRKHRSSP